MTDYRFENYTNNWSHHWSPSDPFPTTVPGVNLDLGFAVPNPDGTFNTNSYPIAPGTYSPAQPGTVGLAVGGWTTSQPGGELNAILTHPLGPDGTLTPAQQTLIQSIVAAAKANGQTNVIMDYENYSSPPPNPEIYTKFLQTLGDTLHKQGIKLEIAMSPKPQNQQFYDLSTLVSTGCVDRFQAMCYDYAAGLSPPMTVGSNCGVNQTRAYLNKLVGNKPGQIPPDKVLIGLSLYGLEFQLGAAGQGKSPAEVQAALSAGTLTAQGYTNPQAPQISDDNILKNIGGDWSNPQKGWTLLHDNANPPNYYYYNQEKNQLISAFPPQSIKDFASMVQTNFPGVAGFFAWDSDKDMGGKMMQDVIDALNTKPLSVKAAIQEVQNWLHHLPSTVSSDWIAQQEQFLQKTPPATTEALAKWLNSVFSAQTGGKDIYFKNGLLTSSPNGNLHNQIDALLQQYPSLLQLKLNIPKPTFADQAMALLQGWSPDSTGGAKFKPILLAQLEKQNSAYPEKELTSWVYQQPSSDYQPISAADTAWVLNITGASV